METLHSFVKASRLPPPSGGARMPEMLVVGQMMEYFERPRIKTLWRPAS